MQVEVLESVTKTIGSLALAYPYLRRLGVAESIAEVVTVTGGIICRAVGGIGYRVRVA